MKKIIAQYKSNPQLFIESYSESDLVKIIKYANNKYYNGVQIMNDEEYDYLIKEIISY